MSYFLFFDGKEESFYDAPLEQTAKFKKLKIGDSILATLFPLSNKGTIYKVTRIKQLNDSEILNSSDYVKRFQRMHPEKKITKITIRMTKRSASLQWFEDK